MSMTNCLVVVGMQNAFVTGPLAVPGAAMVLTRIVNKMKRFCGSIVLTREAHDTLPAVQDNSRQWDLLPEICRIQQEKCLPVYQQEALSDGKLTKDVKMAHARLHFHKIEVVGFCTDTGVANHARALKTALPGVPVWVDSACCAGHTPDLHKTTLKALGNGQMSIA